MKSIIESRYNLAPRDIYQQRTIQQDKTKLSEELQNNKNSRVFPQDKIDITGIAKQVIQSIDNRQIELTYSIPLKKISVEIINKDGSRIEVKNENLPKELREISDPEVFSSFLRNTYAKVTTLSDGEYRLYINHRLLGGDEEYLYRMLCSMRELLINKTKSSKETLQILNIDYNKYRKVDDAILVSIMGLSVAVALEGLKNNSISIINIDSARFESAIDAGVHLQLKKLTNEAYDFLSSSLKEHGLEDLKNKIFKSEDHYVVSLVRHFFNSVNSSQASDTDIKGYLTQEGFINFIYTKLITRPAQVGKENFIKNFKKFEIQATPTNEERIDYSMPKDGICHGSCLVSTTLEEDTFKDRKYILQKSSFLQQEYHKVRNPDQIAIHNLLISKVTEAVNSLPEEITTKVTNEKVKNLIKNNGFQDFLKENNISLTKLLTESRTDLQKQALQNNLNEELRTFINAGLVLNDSDLSVESFNTILEALNDKILLSEGLKKHMILITLEEKTIISEVIRGKDGTPQAHDIMIRVDTNAEGYISLVIFSDLQEAALYAIEPTKLSKIIKESTPLNVEIINSYAQNFAIHLFDRITAKYIAI